MKPFLLIVGSQYYPRAYTGNWRGCFSSSEEALEELSNYSDSDYDWYEIVDLRDWMSGENNDY